MLRRRHDLDPEAGLGVGAEEADRRPPEARLLRVVVQPGRDEQRVRHHVVGERRGEREHDETPRLEAGEARGEEHDREDEGAEPRPVVPQRRRHDVDDDAAEPPERVERDERPGAARLPGN